MGPRAGGLTDQVVAFGDVGGPAGGFRVCRVGHVLGAAAGLRETDRLREVLGERHRWHAVRGHLHELNGDLPAAATAYAEAARRATDVAERDHLIRQAARTRAHFRR